jgi:hypothetical protein
MGSGPASRLGRTFQHNVCVVCTLIVNPRYGILLTRLHVSEFVNGTDSEEQSKGRGKGFLVNRFVRRLYEVHMVIHTRVA